MQVPNINFKQVGGQIKNGLQKVGEKAIDCKSFASEKFDTFISSKIKLSKENKQAIVGAGVVLAGVALIGIAIKNIVHKIKEKIDEK